MAKSSGSTREVHAPTTGEEREQMIESTTKEIEKKFGKGSIMRYGEDGPDLHV